MEFIGDVSSSIMGLLTLSDFPVLADFKNIYVVIMIYDLDKKKKKNGISNKYNIYDITNIQQIIIIIAY